MDCKLAAGAYFGVFEMLYHSLLQKCNHFSLPAPKQPAPNCIPIKSLTILSQPKPMTPDDWTPDLSIEDGSRCGIFVPLEVYGTH